MQKRLLHTTGDERAGRYLFQQIAITGLEVNVASYPIIRLNDTRLILVLIMII